MKTLKKQISILLAVLMLMGTIAVMPISASAESLVPEDETARSVFIGIYNTMFNEQPSRAKAYKIETSDENDDYYLIDFKSGDCTEEKYYKQIGDYCEYSNVTNKWFESGYVVYNLKDDQYFEWIENYHGGPSQWVVKYHNDPKNYYSFTDIAENEEMINAVLECIEKNNLEPRICRIEDYDPNKTYEPSTTKEYKDIADIVPSDADTQTIRFYMPEDWKTIYNETYDGKSLSSCKPGIYWYQGSYNCEDYYGKDNYYVFEDSWDSSLGYYISKTEEADGNIFVAEVPKDFKLIMFNNMVRLEDNDYEENRDRYNASVETSFITAEGYEPGEDMYGFYPDGLESVEDMIFVPYKSDIVELYRVDNGEWFYYYGGGKYGAYKTLAEAEANDAVYSGGEFPEKKEKVKPTTEKVEPTTEVVEPTNAGEQTNYLYITGSAGLCGKEWSESEDLDSRMTILNPNAESGTVEEGRLEKTFKNISAGTYEFKIYVINTRGKKFWINKGKTYTVEVEKDNSDVKIEYQSS
ncbi:MAG: hypothetical protein VZR54_08925, partial [Ruminococcus sp.]|nr:hypothetical protein [Ruminococcus sp.]